MDRRDKRRLVEERRKKWMLDRDVSAIRDSTLAECQREVDDVEIGVRVHSPERVDARQAQRLDGGRREQSGGRLSRDHPNQTGAGIPTDVFLNRITERLAQNIRSEVQRELQMSTQSDNVRDAISERMESFLQAELGTHVCKICFELMASPDHTPMLLFPCGHTFCKKCLDIHSKKCVRAKPTCPYCRAGIVSTAVNQSLKDLIDQFAAQRALVHSGEVVSVDDIFKSKRAGQANRSVGRDFDGSRSINANAHDDFYPSSSPYSPMQQNALASGTNEGRGTQRHIKSPSSSSSSSKFAAQLKNCEIRETILQNELTDARDEEAGIHKRKKSLTQAQAHLRSERVKLQERIDLLLEEKALLDEHLDDKQAKLNVRYKCTNLWK
jgi:hypothetical protein